MCNRLKSQIESLLKSTKQSLFRECKRSSDFDILFHVHFLPSYPSIMEDETTNQPNSAIEDEKQFTDLLFGDLEEIPTKVQSFQSN